MPRFLRSPRKSILASCALAICTLALHSDLARAAAPKAHHPSGATTTALTGPSMSGSIAEASADGIALQKQIDALLATAPISTGRISIEVRSLADGHLVYAKNPDELLNPASNTKLATAAAALLRLGPEYKFSTDILADKSYARGKAKALYVKGRGDPSINTERLDAFARDLARRGLAQVGDLVLDDTQFDDNPWGPGWESESSDKPYASGVGALSLNRNSVGIYVLPGERAGQKAHVALEPGARGFFDIVNSVQTSRPTQRKRIIPHTYPLPERTRVAVAGRIPVGGDPIILYRRVTDPTFYFGDSFKEILQQHGIKVTGKVLRGTAPADAKLITSYDSPELSEIVRDMNKASSNFIAEMLLKTLGAELQGTPGTWPKGALAIEDALAELGIPKGSYQLKNGSGLNDSNRFSSHQFVTLLTALYARFPLAAEFVASLPVAGRDGSLRLRMDGTEAAGRMRAKTGTLDRAVALSGFLQSVSGEELVFSLLVNDWAGKVPPIVQDADKFGAMLASLGERPAERQAALAQQAALELPPAEESARIATYAQLAQARDKKNLGMLRGAVRTERDPLVRLMAADALVRTDAESGTGPLLDALPPGPELFNKLRAAASALKLPMPVLPSLLDLAADGNADAFARLLSLCPSAVAIVQAPARASEQSPARASETPRANAPADTSSPSDGAALPAQARDESLAQALAEGLADVSEASPEEMLAALKSAPVEQARAAAELIGSGFAASGVEMDDSSFAQLVLAASARADPDAAEARLWVKLIERRGARVFAPDAGEPPSDSGG